MNSTFITCFQVFGPSDAVDFVKKLLKVRAQISLHLRNILIEYEITWSVISFASLIIVTFIFTLILTNAMLVVISFLIFSFQSTFLSHDSILKCYLMVKMDFQFNLGERTHKLPSDGIVFQFLIYCRCGII